MCVGGMPRPHACCLLTRSSLVKACSRPCSHAVARSASTKPSAPQGLSTCTAIQPACSDGNGIDPTMRTISWEHARERKPALFSPLTISYHDDTSHLARSQTKCTLLHYME